MKIAPFGNRLVIRPIDMPATTEAGIFLPESSQYPSPRVAELVAIGQGEWIDGEWVPIPTLYVGMKLLVDPRAGVEVFYDGVRYRLINIGAVIGVWED